MQPFSYNDSTALVTGASRGIGAALAKALAAKGIHALALVARSEDDLENLAMDISDKHGIRVEAIPADLTRPDAAEQIATEVARRGLTIDLLVNNAGFGIHNPFEATTPKQAREMVAVNVQALTALTHRFLPGMMERSRGAIINIASTAAFQPVPYMAVYAATKAFVLSFTEALAVELADKGATGVRMVALCPGATTTTFGDNMLHSHFTEARQHTPERVAEETLRALDRSATVAVVGKLNYAMTLSERFAPRGMVARVAGNLFRPDRAEHVGSKAATDNRWKIFLATLGVASAAVATLYVARRKQRDVSENSV